MRKLIVFAILVLLLSLSAGCNLSTEPRCDIDRYTTNTQPYLDEWSAAVAQANITPRLKLDTQISCLQEIKRSVENMEVEKCLEVAHTELLNHMNATIEAFVAFRAEDRGSAMCHLGNAEAYIERYSSEINRLLEQFN